MKQMLFPGIVYFPLQRNNNKLRSFNLQQKKAHEHITIYLYPFILPIRFFWKIWLTYQIIRHKGDSQKLDCAAAADWLFPGFSHPSVCVLFGSMHTSTPIPTRLSDLKEKKDFFGIFVVFTSFQDKTFCLVLRWWKVNRRRSWNTKTQVGFRRLCCTWYVDLRAWICSGIPSLIMQRKASASCR